MRTNISPKIIRVHFVTIVFIQAKSGDIIHLDFEVIDGDDFEMQATITDVEDPGTALKTFNTFSVRTEWTADSEGNREEYRYKLCFKNMLYMESRMVSFSWHVNQDELLRAAHSEHLEGKLKSRVNMLWEEIDTVRDLVHYFGLQQNNQHRMNQDTNTRVMWASAFEVFAVIAMTTMQIYALKSTLERRRRV
eukprot:g4717.t1